MTEVMAASDELKITLNLIIEISGELKQTVYMAEALPTLNEVQNVCLRIKDSLRRVPEETCKRLTEDADKIRLQSISLKDPAKATSRRFVINVLAEILRDLGNLESDSEVNPVNVSREVELLGYGLLNVLNQGETPFDVYDFLPRMYHGISFTDPAMEGYYSWSLENHWHPLPDLK